MRWLAVVLLPLFGCATYSDELERGQTAFEANQHERALAIFRSLEADQGHFSTSEHAQYAYLRGMTDYRIGYVADARYWLGMAYSIEEASPGALPADWKKRLQTTMTTLNDVVYKSGIESLSIKKTQEIDSRIDTNAKTAPTPSASASAQ